jgi:hypothetical protein
MEDISTIVRLLSKNRVGKEYTCEWVVERPILSYRDKTCLCGAESAGSHGVFCLINSFTDKRIFVDLHCILAHFSPEIGIEIFSSRFPTTTTQFKIDNNVKLISLKDLFPKTAQRDVFVRNLSFRDNSAHNSSDRDKKTFPSYVEKKQFSPSSSPSSSPPTVKLVRNLPSEKVKSKPSGNGNGIPRKARKKCVQCSKPTINSYYDYCARCHNSNFSKIKCVKCNNFFKTINSQSKKCSNCI